MLQESRTEEESRITLTGLTGLLGTSRVIGTDTRVGGQTRLLGTAGVTGMAAWVSRLFGLLGSAGVTETATRSREILSGLRKIQLPRQARLWKIRLTQKAGLQKKFG
jgi:hypothetical protein